APLRDLFRRHVDGRALAHSPANDPAFTQTFTQTKRAEGAALQTEIWTQAVAATQRPDAAGASAMRLLPALNAVFDITTTRAAVGR
ncbi:MAG: hypothetical protein RRY41_07300, partial [Burkholderiaceae bacterium]